MNLMIDLTPSHMVQIGVESPFKIFDLKAGNIQFRNDGEWLFVWQKYAPRKWDLVVCGFHLGISFPESNEK